MYFHTIGTKYIQVDSPCSLLWISLMTPEGLKKYRGKQTIDCPETKLSSTTFRPKLEILKDVNVGCGIKFLTLCLKFFSKLKINFFGLGHFISFNITCVLTICVFQPYKGYGSTCFGHSISWMAVKYILLYFNIVSHSLKSLCVVVF